MLRLRFTFVLRRIGFKSRLISRVRYIRRSRIYFNRDRRNRFFIVLVVIVVFIIAADVNIPPEQLRRQPRILPALAYGQRQLVLRHDNMNALHLRV